MRRLRIAGAALGIVLATGLLGGCGGDDPEPIPAAGEGPAAEGDLDEELDQELDDLPVDLPEECLTQFLGLMSEPDLDGSALPESWPEPPIEATLCKTQGSGTDVEEVGYATAVPPEEVLDAYAEALTAAGAAPERTEGDGYGAGTLFGELEGIGYVVQPRTGSYEIVLALP